MVTQHSGSTHTNELAIGRRPHVATTAKHLYDAECALHAAHQSHVDEWINAASNRLHEALTEHLAAAAATVHEDGTDW